ncbi:MAG TPA: hypothetical protein VNS32_05885, partial [Flavisolibacter sp.]|nr:hypothetical protein [Flavisolibacter sp.]
MRKYLKMNSSLNYGLSGFHVKCTLIVKSLVLGGSLLIAMLGHTQKIKSQKNSDLFPIIPVGMDAYRNWFQLPVQRIGDRAYMRSTYDRDGGNQSADASHYLFANEEDYNVSLDVKGTGVLYFFRANHWHGSPWHFLIDGKDNLVKETGTQDPVNALKKFPHTEFIPGLPFPQPLAYTWSTTKGADLIWTPMSFSDSLRIAYSRTRYGTGYYIYHLYSNEQKLSQPIRSWDLNKAPDEDVVHLINQSGTDIAPQNVKKKTGRILLNQEKVLLSQINAPSSVVRAFKLSISLEKALDLERLRLMVYWDQSAYPSIDAPLCMFFG